MKSSEIFKFVPESKFKALAVLRVVVFLLFLGGPATWFFVHSTHALFPVVGSFAVALVISLRTHALVTRENAQRLAQGITPIREVFNRYADARFTEAASPLTQADKMRLYAVDAMIAMATVTLLVIAVSGVGSH